MHGKYGYLSGFKRLHKYSIAIGCIISIKISPWYDQRIHRIPLAKTPEKIAHTKSNCMEKLIRLSPPGRSGHRLLTVLLALLAVICTLPSFAQNSVKGKVTDETGAGMPGVNIIQKGTTNGTTTDASGNYTLGISADQAILVFSFIGYTTQEVSIDNRTTIDISLAPSAETLNEIVVVGYGTQLKRDVTGAILTVSSDVLQQTASSDVMGQLKGHAAGVDIVSNSAVPGGSGQIRIRGNRTMVASTTNATNDAQASDNLDQPLLVVDGIPFGGTISDINPGDIANMEILKDASATAIYGSRGAGGVILITTKRGKTGKSTISYDGYYGVSSTLGNLRVFNGPEYAAFKAESAAGNTAAPGTTTYPLTTQEQAALDAGISTDWQKLIYQQGAISNHNLSVMGGTESASYSMNAGYFKEKGIIPNQDFTRYSIRGTIDNKIGNRIRIGLNTLNNVSYQNTPGGSGVPQGLMRLTPLAPPYNDDGTINLLPQVGQTDNAVVNPLTLITKKDAILARSRKLRTFNSLYGEVDILKGLKYRINVGLDFSQTQQDNYSGVQTYVNTSPNPAQTTANTRNFESWQYAVENLLIYEKMITPKHKIGFTGLYSFQKNHNQNSGFFGVGVPIDYVQNSNMALAASTTVVNPQNPLDNPNKFEERGLISFMGRLNYNFDGRVNVTATVRRDGSSILSGEKYFTYPAFAASWNLSNEEFIQTVPFISSLKLRAGWGVTGAQGLNPYSTLGGLTIGYYNFGQGTVGNQIGYTVNNLPNSTLKWQSTAQSNFGLEFGFLKNRITGVVEVYSQQTKDILLPVSLPPSNGAPQTFMNVGKSSGNGLELTLSTVNVKASNGLTWTTDLNYFYNREKITQLSNPNEKSNVGNGWFVGQPLSVIYDYKKIGIWQTNDPGLTTQTSPVQHPGQIRVADVDSPAHDGVPDGKITADDRMIIGNFQPKFDAGMTNRIQYKRFDFSFTLYARIGMKMVVPYVSSEPNGSNTQGYSFFNQGRNNQLKVDYWTPSNPTNAFPRPDASIGAPMYSSTLSYMDGSFVKLRTVNLGYDIPVALLQKAGIQSLHVYVSAVNPWVIWSPFVKGGFGPDPEGNGYGGAVNAQGTSVNSSPGRQISVNANNPAVKQFIFGLNLKF